MAAVSAFCYLFGDCENARCMETAGTGVIKIELLSDTETL